MALRNNAVAGADGEHLFPVPIACMRAEAAATFDIYIRHRADSKPILYREQHVALDAAAFERLRDAGIDTLYLRLEDEAAYYQYLDDNLPTLLREESLAFSERSALLYDSAQHLMREVMEQPRSGKLVKQARRLVEHSASYILDHEEAFETLLQVISYDYYTYTHSVNVYVFSVALAERLGIMDNGELLEFGQSVLLHDIGKSQIDAAIVNAKGQLTDQQWRIMKQHPVYGYDLMREGKVLSDRGLDVVRHHHEKLTGNGYPDGLRNGQIRPWVRISTICDIFDALTTRRSYKEAMDSFRALKLMREEMADELDKQYFAAFVKMMAGKRT